MVDHVIMCRAKEISKQDMYLSYTLRLNRQPCYHGFVSNLEL